MNINFLKGENIVRNYPDGITLTNLRIIQIKKTLFSQKIKTIELKKIDYCEYQSKFMIYFLVLSVLSLVCSFLSFKFIENIKELNILFIIIAIISFICFILYRENYIEIKSGMGIIRIYIKHMSKKTISDLINEIENQKSNNQQ